MAEDYIINVKVQGTNQVKTQLEDVGNSASKTGKVASLAMGPLDQIFGGLPSKLMAARQGVLGLNLGFKGMKAAIAATGIGLLVVALGEIIANWEEITSLFKDDSREKQLKKDAAAIERTLEAEQRYLQVARARGMSQEEYVRKQAELGREEEKMLRKRMEAAKLAGDNVEAEQLAAEVRQKHFEWTYALLQEEGRRNELLDDAKMTLDETYEAEVQRNAVVAEHQSLLTAIEEELAQKEAGRAMFAERMAQYQREGRGNSKEAKNIQELILQDEQEITRLKGEQGLLQEAINKKLQDYDDRIRQQKREERRQKRLANEKYLADQILSINRDLELRRIEDDEKRAKRELEMSYNDLKKEFEQKKASDEQLRLLEEQYQLDIQDIEKDFKAKRDAEKDKDAEKEKERKAKLTEFLKDEETKERDAVIAKYEEMLALAEEFGYNEAELLIMQKEELAAIEEKYGQDDINRVQQIEEAKQALRQQALQGTFDILKNLTAASEKDTEESAKKAFKRNKAISIAETLVSTYQAAQKAYASQIIPGDPTSPLRAQIAAGIAVAAGLANVAAIKSQKFTGGGTAGGGGGGGGAGSIGGGTQSVGVDVGSLIPNQQTPTPEPVRAYVVSNEISNRQALDRELQIQTTL